MPRRCHTDMRSVAFQRKGVEFCDGQGPCACLRGKSGDISAPKCGESCGEADAHRWGARTAEGNPWRQMPWWEISAVQRMQGWPPRARTDRARRYARNEQLSLRVRPARGHPRRSVRPSISRSPYAATHPGSNAARLCSEPNLVSPVLPGPRRSGGALKRMGQPQTLEALDGN
jgi:hypothetical protein